MHILNLPCRVYAVYQQVMAECDHDQSQIKQVIIENTDIRLPIYSRVQSGLHKLHIFSLERGHAINRNWQYELLKSQISPR